MEKQSLKTKTTRNAPHDVHPAYHIIFLVLAVFTVLEVGASYLGGGIKIPILIILAAAKATLVILFFMHLRYDRPIFAAPLIIGFVLAIPIILVVVLVMPVLTR